MNEKYGQRENMERYWQNVIALGIKFNKNSIEKFKSHQNVLFKSENGEKFEKEIEKIKKDDKNEIDKAIYLENYEEILKAINYIKKNNLKKEEFKEFDEKTIEFYMLENREIYKNIEYCFYDIMLAKINKFESVEDIYNEISKISSSEEEIINKEKIKEFKEKVYSKINSLIEQNKISILPQKDVETER